MLTSPNLKLMKLRSVMKKENSKPKLELIKVLIMVMVMDMDMDLTIFFMQNITTSRDPNSRFRNQFIHENINKTVIVKN